METPSKESQQNCSDDYRVLSERDSPLFVDKRGFALEIDTRVYELGAIFRAAYRFSGRFAIFLSPADDDVRRIHLFATALDSSASTTAVPGEFMNELLDQTLRCRLGREMQAIRELVAARAFAEGNLLL